MYRLKKTNCFIDLSNRVDDQPIVFVDGDGFSIRNVNALLNQKFDLSLTNRRSHEQCWDFNTCRLVNLGLAADAKKREKFQRYWLQVSLECQEKIADQTTLTRIVEEQDREVLLSGGQGSIEVDGAKLRLQVLPGDEYKFKHIERLSEGGGEIPGSIRGLHFKSGRFNDARLKLIIEQANFGDRSSRRDRA